MSRKIDSAAVEKLRDDLDWTQGQMARVLGCNQSTVSRMEKGRIPIDGPMLKLLERIRAEKSLWKSRGRQ